MVGVFIIGVAVGIYLYCKQLIEFSFNKKERRVTMLGLVAEICVGVAIGIYLYYKQNYKVII